MREIAEKGPDAFYRGPIADKIVQSVANAPRNRAVMTRDDIAGYKPKPREPLCGVYRLYRICSVPPSTSGGVTVLQILALLERFPSTQLQPGTLSTVHLVSEASRLAYADRERWLGDPDFVSVPLQGLLDRGYVAMRSRLIDPERSMGIAMRRNATGETGRDHRLRTASASGRASARAICPSSTIAARSSR